jgi:hypothetical protein
MILTSEGAADPSEAFPSEGGAMGNFGEPEFDDFDGGNDVNIGHQMWIQTKIPPD